VRILGPSGDAVRLHSVYRRLIGRGHSIDAVVTECCTYHSLINGNSDSSISAEHGRGENCQLALRLHCWLVNGRLSSKVCKASLHLKRTPSRYGKWYAPDCIDESEPIPKRGKNYI
jgi:hypothetical protein